MPQRHFAAGTILAELLLGVPVFSGVEELEVLLRMYEASAPALGSRLFPPRIDELVRTALARDAKARYQSAQEFSNAIRAAAHSESLPLGPANVLTWLSDVDLIELHSAARPIVVQRRRASPAEIVRRLDRVQQARELLGVDAPFGADAPPESGQRASSPPATCRGRAYRVRQADGRLGDTLSLPELAGAVATGRVRHNDELDAGGKSIGPAEVSEIARLVSCAAYAYDEPIEQRALWQRPFQRARLPAMLFELARSRASGLLVVRDGSNESASTSMRVYPALLRPTSAASYSAAGWSTAAGSPPRRWCARSTTRSPVAAIWLKLWSPAVRCALQSC